MSTEPEAASIEAESGAFILRTRRLAVPEAGVSAIRFRLLMQFMSDINIGKIIEEELRSQNHTVVWLAEQLNCNRTNIYKIFQRQSIDTDLLLRISTALDRNFFAHYTEQLDK